MANRDPNPRHRWKPGQSGNPAGRPKRRTLVALLREQLEEPGFEGSTATKQDELVSRLLSLATDGDVAAIRLVFAASRASTTT